MFDIISEKFGNSVLQYTQYTEEGMDEYFHTPPEDMTFSLPHGRQIGPKVWPIA